MSSYRFSLLESNGFFDSTAFVSLLRGEIASYVARKLVCDGDCKRIERNFEGVETNVRTDDVPGGHVGAFHYGKTLEEYFHEVERTATQLTGLLEGTSDPVSFLHKTLSAAAGKAGLEYRPAMNRRRVAGRFVARRWSGRGMFSLRPHEDVAQLSHPAQKDFEIQKVGSHNVIGVNLCVRAAPVGGALRIWNVRPSNGDRQRFGLQETGYPYPEAMIAHAEKMELWPHVGDVYCVNGTLLHAVTQQDSRSARLTLSFLCGLVDDSTVVYWT